ncbi:hypothetical protein JJB09_22730 [Rhizobium sp. KVB221]|uniref:Uncharacterized protein n=1 Tax=Rhizobium setariae TaxID=2801340 RepID=A0A936YQG9_9HYPH|nr:hypothetical protein [Rhizobium setariae]MBL0374833.1 hypothetical protein [Rhizobium setariae]
MIAKANSDSPLPRGTLERISYIKQMLAELSQVARTERAELLVYLLEMAFTEAGDLLSGKSVTSLAHVNRNETGRVPMQSAGKVKFE